VKVLIADDEAVSRRLLESSLTRWGYQAIVASDGREAERLLSDADAPKLAILDWMMPGVDGLELCRRIRQRRSEPYTYLLLLTGKRQRRDVIEGLDAGADDYVTKPFDPQELRVRLRTGKRILCLQEQLISAREALREMATRDSLTGLWNRASILDILANDLARMRRQEGSLAVVMVDLDHFKASADSHGHQVGDAVLREAAQAMRCSTRPYDSVGRHGGEEFLIVLPGCDATNAVSHAERLRAAVGRVCVETYRGPVRITASMGVALAEGHVDVASLVRMADGALYQAKHRGRDRVELAEECEPLQTTG
jgi:two-component system cell cycle response regulator